MEIRLDSRYGTKLGEVQISGSSTEWKEYTTSLSTATGVHDIYFVFTGSSSGELFYLDYWKMSRTNTTVDVPAPSGDELVKMEPLRMV